MNTVLVVDDHPDLLELLQVIFETHGYRVHTAQDGVEAIEAVTQHAPDVIVMDLWMPRLDGIDATRRIRSLAGRSHVPIIAHTAYPAALGAEPDLFTKVCRKPCPPERLLGLVADVLGV